MLLWTLGCLNLFKLVFFAFFGGDIYPGVELLGHIVVLFLIFEEPPYCFPQYLHQFTLPPTVYEGCLLSASSPAFVISILSVITVLMGVRWCLTARLICVSWVLVICISRMLVMLSTFHVPVGHQHFFFGKISIQVCCPFLNQVVCFLDVELYKLFITPYRSHHLQILPPIHWAVFLLCWWFAVQMLLSLIRSHLFFHYFHYLRRQIKKKKKNCYNLCQRVLCFPLGVVWFLLIFRALTHFDFTFTHGIRERSNFLFFNI